MDLTGSDIEWLEADYRHYVAEQERFRDVSAIVRDEPPMGMESWLRQQPEAYRFAHGVIED